MAQHRDAGAQDDALGFCLAEALRLAARLSPPTHGLLDRLLDGAGTGGRR